jgi:hypothetical protein
MLPAMLRSISKCIRLVFYLFFTIFILLLYFDFYEGQVLATVAGVPIVRRLSEFENNAAVTSPQSAGLFFCSQEIPRVGI